MRVFDLEEDSGRGRPFLWMEKYKAALLEQDSNQAIEKIQQALKAVASRKESLGRGSMDSAEWNLLQYAEIVLHRIGRGGMALELMKVQQQPEHRALSSKKAA